MINIEYEKALDFGHCESMKEASEKLSELTNLLNKVLVVRQEAKKDILEECSRISGYNPQKLSWDNKLICLSTVKGNSDLSNLWQDADMAYKQIKAKQDQVFEDINCLKKMADFTPH